MDGAGSLTRAWVTASAALPLGWEIAGVALGPTTDERDPMVIQDEVWVAWARDEHGDRRNGHGSTPQQALNDLAHELAELRGSMSGGAG